MNRSNTLTLFKREIRAFFFSPAAWIVLTLFLAVSGWLFFSTFFLAGRADLRDFFSLLPFLFAVTIPALTMRLYSEEFGTGTYEVLKTLPVTDGQVLAGKFLAILLYTAVLLLPTISYPLFISLAGDLDWGPVAGGYAGALLLGASYGSLGLLCSSLTASQITAFITSTAACLFLTLIDRMLLLLPNRWSGLFQALSADYHFRSFTSGVVDSRDLLYFLSLTAFSLLLVRGIHNERQ